MQLRYSGIETKLGVHVPHAFVAMMESGLLTLGDPRCLILSDTKWLSVDEIGARTPRPSRVNGLIDFAVSSRADSWSWYCGWIAGTDLPVVHCPRDRNTGRGYAPDFKGCIYRLLLEEFSSSWLVGSLADTPADLGPLFQRYARSVAKHLPDSWSRVLVDAAMRPVIQIEEDVFGVVSADEAAAAIHRDLAFAGLDQKLRTEA